MFLCIQINDTSTYHNCKNGQKPTIFHKHFWKKYVTLFSPQFCVTYVASTYSMCSNTICHFTLRTNAYTSHNHEKEHACIT